MPFDLPSPSAAQFYYGLTLFKIALTFQSLVQVSSAVLVPLICVFKLSFGVATVYLKCEGRQRYVSMTPLRTLAADRFEIGCCKAGIKIEPRHLSQSFFFVFLASL